ncbi:MAG: hypothetical protein K8R68_11895 [Bacteroidales bacterium]|nr:hypothetical protein [Bacteroidales bacterium]
MDTTNYNTLLEGLRIPAIITWHKQDKEATISIIGKSILAICISGLIKASYPTESEAFQHLQRIKNTYEYKSPTYE